MRPRLALLLGALVVPALPLLVAAPAHAVGTICVNVAPAGCPAGATTAVTIQAAITQAVSGTKILVGPGTGYTDGPYVLPAGVGIQGSGAGTGASATVLSLPAGSQTYLTANGGNVQDLRISMITGNGATGLEASNGSTVDNVVVFGAGATSSTGIRAHTTIIQDTTVNLTGGAGNTGVTTSGTNSVLDSTVNGGGTGYEPSGNDSVSQLTVNLAVTAIRATNGVLGIDDSLLDLGTTGSAGLLVQPAGTATAATADATFLTVVGGSATSRGVAADATASGGPRTATVNLSNSIVRGPHTSLARAAGSGPANLTATSSDYQTKDVGVTADATNLTDVDPAFVDPAGANYDLRAGSPVIDKGAGTGAGLHDLAGRNRSFDGNRDGIAVPDMGAYELNDVTAPTTVILSGPSGPTKDTTPVFTFRSGPDAAFDCAIDSSPFQPCSSPATTTPLPDGPHTFTVRAHDQVFNLEANPPKRTFTVDTAAPDTAFTKKAPKRFFKPQVKFKFVSPEAGVSFQCQLDGGAWRSCRSPFRYTVRIGKHTLAVRAVDAAGNVDSSPVHDKFRRIPRPHRHHHHHQHR